MVDLTKKQAGNAHISTRFDVYFKNISTQIYLYL